MIIHKVINNNIATILDENGKEIIVMGKGIAFKARPGDEIDAASINKKFFMQDDILNERLSQLMDEIPIEYFEVAGEIIKYAKLSLDKTFKESIYIGLTDHIHTAVQRHKDGIPLNNLLKWELKRYYEREYEVALKALHIINDRFDVALGEDEAGFLTLHLVDSTLDSNSMEDVYEMTKVIQDISNIVKYYFKFDYSTSSVSYYRFITHIRFFAQRVVMKTTYGSSGEDNLYHIIKEKYTNAYQCMLKIESYVKRQFDYHISDDEKLYLMIHIERVVYKSGESTD